MISGDTLDRVARVEAAVRENLQGAETVLLLLEMDEHDEQRYSLAWRRKARHEHEPQDRDGWTYGTHKALLNVGRAARGGEECAIVWGHYSIGSFREALADAIERAGR